jgi:Zn finger protein HypA/HybF involved in hydrogenase expression
LIRELLTRTTGTQGKPVSLPLLLQSFGSIGVFASRAFLPAFVTALLLRFGPHVPWLAQAGLLPHVRDVPTWFTSDAALVILGILAALELVAERFPEAHDVLDRVHDYLKTGMAVLTYLGVLNATDRAAAQEVIRQAGPGDTLLVLAVGAGVFFASRVRRGIIGPLVEADEDDDLGLQALIRWVEDLWSGLGPLALIVVPLLTIAAFGLAILILVVIERRIEGRAERSKVACANCGELIHASALACPNCHAPVKEPRDVGLLGEPKARPADIPRLPDRLIAVKRCPICATRFDRQAVKQTCRACGHRLMDGPRFALGYIASIDRRVPLVLVVCFVLGLIPVLGVIPGVIYYRLAIVAPFRRYIPPGRGFLLRWGVRLAVVVLVAFQWLPVAGGFAVTFMALINYAVYRGAYRKLALAP